MKKTYEDVIRLFGGNLKSLYNWEYVCKYYDLSEDFIREWAHKIEWKFVK